MGKEYNVEAGIYDATKLESYAIIFPSAHNLHVKHYTYVIHPDLDLLKVYVPQCFQEFWESPI